MFLPIISSFAATHQGEETFKLSLSSSLSWSISVIKRVASQLFNLLSSLFYFIMGRSEERPTVITPPPVTQPPNSFSAPPVPDILITATSPTEPAVAQQGLSVWLQEQIDIDFIQKVKTLAPNQRCALHCIHTGINYAIWHDAYHQRVHIQDLTHSNTRKWSFACNEQGAVSFWIDHQQTFDPAENSQTIFEALKAEVNHVHDRYEAIRGLTNRFNPRCLALLYHFFSGPNGENYRYRVNTPQKGALNYTLSDGKEYMQWVQIDQGNKLYFNFQEKGQYYCYSQMDKLGIHLDAEGQILNVYVNGNPWNEDAFAPNWIWNQRLTEIVHQFLLRDGFKTHQRYLILHPLVLAQCPEEVLRRCCSDSQFNIFQRFPSLKFLTDTLEVGVGIDAGGLRCQFMCELPRHLLDNAPTRTVRLNSGIPFLQDCNSIQSAEKAVLKNIGKLITFCFQNQDPVMGRMFSQPFFDMMHTLVSLPNSMDIKTLIRHASRHFATEENVWMWDVCEAPRELNDEEKGIIENILCLEVEKENYFAAISTYLMETYRPSILAAQAILEGIPATVQNSWKNLSAHLINERVQGLAFNRADIASRVETHSQNPVVQQKASWLKEFILSPDLSDEWIKKLVFTVTGQEAVTAHTKFLIEETHNATCLAHTCFKSLDVPHQHVRVGTEDPEVRDPKQLFFNNLSLTMSQEGYDIG